MVLLSAGLGHGPSLCIFPLDITASAVSNPLLSNIPGLHVHNKCVYLGNGNILRFKILQDDLDFGFRHQVHFIIDVRLDTVTNRFAVLTHHDYGGSIGGLKGQHEIHNIIPGRVENRFHPALPHQTVLAVLPHTAFRCSSLQGMRFRPDR